MTVAPHSNSPLENPLRREGNLDGHPIKMLPYTFIRAAAVGPMRVQVFNVPTRDQIMLMWEHVNLPKVIGESPAPLEGEYCRQGLALQDVNCEDWMMTLHQRGKYNSTYASHLNACRRKLNARYTICQGPRSLGESGHCGRLQDQIAGPPPARRSGDVGPAYSSYFPRPCESLGRDGEASEFDEAGSERSRQGWALLGVCTAKPRNSLNPKASGRVEAATAYARWRWMHSQDVFRDASGSWGLSAAPGLRAGRSRLDPAESGTEEIEHRAKTKVWSFAKGVESPVSGLETLDRPGLRSHPAFCFPLLLLDFESRVLVPLRILPTSFHRRRDPACARLIPPGSAGLRLFNVDLLGFARRLIHSLRTWICQIRSSCKQQGEEFEFKFRLAGTILQCGSPIVRTKRRGIAFLEPQPSAALAAEPGKGGHKPSKSRHAAGLAPLMSQGQRTIGRVSSRQDEDEGTFHNAAM
ncbi:uncharacterized protein CLUP02_07403 [Colletotrichum lupini]|uniref:Uncharacterized protein n=1 Tax=Colletotrichum lupini TaxID=145971 RepID=A0A9Q8SSS4_9PEZI|nr:uncharacterized protein CLUP02_07403 [Colletotrichum lupini]UQC81917.1 hypothetical protein CLUP02_07403 [Colletotrichum lupini]